MARVTATSGFTGTSVGVRFVEGVADDVPEGPALAYFRRAAGYAVQDAPTRLAPAAPDDEDDPEDDGQGDAPAPSRGKRKS